MVNSQSNVVTKPTIILMDFFRSTIGYNWGFKQPNMCVETLIWVSLNMGVNMVNRQMDLLFE